MAAMPVLRLLSGLKIGFSPASAPPCRMSDLWEPKCGNTAPVTVVVWNFVCKFATGANRLHDFFDFLSVRMRLYYAAFIVLKWSL